MDAGGGGAIVPLPDLLMLPADVGSGGDGGSDDVSAFCDTETDQCRVKESEFVEMGS